MAEIHYKQVYRLDADTLPHALKLIAAASFLTVDQMQRLFKGSQSKDICRQLGLPESRSEKENCQSIYEYFNSVERRTDD